MSARSLSFPVSLSRLPSHHHTNWKHSSAFRRQVVRQRAPFAAQITSTSQISFSTSSHRCDQATPQDLPSEFPKTQVADGELQQNAAPTLSAEEKVASIEKLAEDLAVPQAPEVEGQTFLDPRNAPDWPRRPRAVQAMYLRPLKRKAEYRVPVCDLQIRSYRAQHIEFFADFALRAAYFLKLPASGPVPLPRIIERWTVPRSHFVFKKAQENFERITMRRLIQIQDGHVDTVEIWLAFLRKHAYHGIGMKANVWRFDKLGVGKTMDAELEEMRKTMEPSLAEFGLRKTMATSQKAAQIMNKEKYKDAPTIA